MRRTLAVLALCAAVSLIPSNQSQALGNTEIEKIYYNTCGPSRTVVGDWYRDCNGHVTSWGATTSFMERYVTDCTTGETDHTYWECGVQVGTLDSCIC